MALPETTDDGVLPPGIHPATVAEVRERFVNAFEGSAARRDIFEWWIEHRHALLELVDVPAQWLCGSFVTGKPAPNDLDIVTVLDGPSFDGLERNRRLLVGMLVRGNYTEELWRIDAWPTFTYPVEHPGHDVAVRARQWLADHFGTDREGRERGLVEIAPDGGGDRG